MIIKGRCRGFAAQLAVYLHDAKNEYVHDLETGTGGSIIGSLRDIERINDALTASNKPLYHAILRAAAHERLSNDQWLYSIDKLGEALKFSGQDRVIVLHTLKDGSTHAHVVWSRVDVEHERVISNSWDAVEWHRIARSLEKEFGLQELNVGAQEIGRKRSQAAASKAHRLEADGGQDTAIVKEDVSFCWRNSTTGEEFQNQLDQMGYELRAGDRSAYVLIDTSTGKPYNPVRLLDGVRLKDFREKCGEVAESPQPERQHRSQAVSNEGVKQLQEVLQRAHSTTRHEMEL